MREAEAEEEDENDDVAELDPEVLPVALLLPLCVGPSTTTGAREGMGVMGGLGLKPVRGAVAGGGRDDPDRGANGARASAEGLAEPSGIAGTDGGDGSIGAGDRLKASGAGLGVSPPPTFPAPVGDGASGGPPSGGAVPAAGDDVKVMRTGLQVR